MEQLKPSEVCVSMIQAFEGYVGKAYKDAVGVWTIGFGTTRPDGQPVKPGMECTKEQAKEWLLTDLSNFMKRVEPSIKVALEQHQVDAIASFIYNVGTGNFLKSTMLKYINAGMMDHAANEFPKWNKAGGRVLKGLVRRRDAEMRMFKYGKI